jgi:hypothetical protein
MLLPESELGVEYFPPFGVGVFPTSVGSFPFNAASTFPMRRNAASAVSVDAIAPSAAVA